MIGRNESKFNIKDSYRLVLIYAILGQFLFPMMVAVPLSAKYVIQGFEAEEIFGMIMGQLNVVSMGLTLAFIIIFYYRKLLYEFIKFKERIPQNIKTVLKYYALGIFLNVGINVALNYFLDLELSQNQEVVESILYDIPIQMAVATIIFAPLLEEIIFRGGLYLGIKDKVGILGARLISSISFGAIHVLPQLANSSTKYEILFIIPYSVLGYVMVKAVEETDSLWGGIGVHFVNNLIATIVLLSV